MRHMLSGRANEAAARDAHKTIGGAVSLLRKPISAGQLADHIEILPRLGARR